MDNQKKTIKKIIINGKEIQDLNQIADISKLPGFLRRFVDKDNNGKIDVIEMAEKEGLLDANSLLNTSNKQEIKTEIKPQNQPSNTISKSPISVPVEGVESKLRLLGLILIAGVAAFIIYKYLV